MPNYNPVQPAKFIEQQGKGRKKGSKNKTTIAYEQGYQRAITDILSANQQLNKGQNSAGKRINGGQPARLLSSAAGTLGATLLPEILGGAGIALGS